MAEFPSRGTPLFTLQSKPYFLESLGELGLMDSGIWLLKSLKLVGTLLSLCYECGILPHPPGMLGAFPSQPLLAPSPHPSVNFTSWFLSNLPRHFILVV